MAVRASPAAEERKAHGGKGAMRKEKNQWGLLVGWLKRENNGLIKDRSENSIELPAGVDFLRLEWYPIALQKPDKNFMTNIK